MALIFCDGFDWYTSVDLGLRWTNVTAFGVQLNVGPTYARSPSGQGIIIGTGASSLRCYKSFGANYASGLVGFAYRPAATPNNVVVFQVADGTTEQISVRTNGSAVPTVTRNGTVLATGSTVLSAGVWYYFELKFTISDASGVIELRLNGASEIASTGSLDTKNTANAYFNTIGPAVTGANSANQYYDDVYVLDTSSGSNTDFLGPIQVVARYPSGNGNHADWTPNGGSNMGSVSEPYEDGNTSFNQSSTANQVDTFEMQNLPAAAGSVYAIAHHLVAAQDGGAARTIRPKYRIGSTDYSGASVNTSTSYQMLTEYKDVSPATSSAWAVSEVNGMETGYELVS